MGVSWGPFLVWPLLLTRLAAGGRGLVVNYIPLLSARLGYRLW